MSLSANAYSGLTHLQDPSEFADDGYGSLMGGGGPKKKKKPVLVLDADELEQAHLAIAMGGQHIMEAEDEPEAMERIRMPSSMLGLAPMGSVAEEDEDDYALSAEDMGSFADQEPEDYSEEGLSEEEEEMEDDSSYIDLNLDHLLRPSSREERDLDDEESIPSIEEQLKKMRALPIPSEEPLDEAEPYSFDSAPELDEPVAFLPEDEGSFYAEPEQVDPLSFEPEEKDSFGPDSEEEPEDMEWEEQPLEPEEQQSLSDEPIAFENLQPGTLSGNDVSDWSVPEAEAEAEAGPGLEAEPEQAPEPASAWSEPDALTEVEPEAEAEPEAEPAPEPECDSEQDWSAFEDAAQAGEADEPTPAQVSELPAIEWTFAVEDSQPEFAEDTAIGEQPELEPQAEDALPADPMDETPESDAVYLPVEDGDIWDTPEAEWPQHEVEHDDPVELAVPAVEESDFDGEAPLSFASEDAAEVAAFVPEPEPAVEPVPELPPRPQNSLRARVYQMEEQRQTRSTSLLGRIWNRLLGR